MSRTAAGAPPRDVVVTFTFESWGDAVRRGMNRPPDRLIQTLLQHEGVDRVLVANPFRSAPVRVARAVVRQGEPGFPTTATQQLVTPQRLRRKDSTDVPTLRTAYARYDEQLRRAAFAMGMQRPVVITTNPFVAAYSTMTWAHRVCFYVRDDWTVMPGREPWWPAFRAAFREVGDSDRCVAAVSASLLQVLAPSGPSLVVPNGVDPQEWAAPSVDPPAWFGDLPSPRALYVGTLDRRLDVDGLRALATARPDLQIGLVGPVGEPEPVAELDRLPNVHVARNAGRADVVSLIRAADVCLLPHRRTALTEAMSPLKLYEYLAGGAPVLSVDLDPVRGFGERVVLAPDVASFAGHLDRALALGRQPEVDRLAFVDAHRWSRRHEAILDLVRA